jgi:hypothetical protein
LSFGKQVIVKPQKKRISKFMMKLFDHLSLEIFLEYLLIKADMYAVFLKELPRIFTLDCIASPDLLCGDPLLSV